MAYGIHKLQISCVVEDEKVSVDWLQETIQEIEDFVSTLRIRSIPLTNALLFHVLEIIFSKFYSESSYFIFILKIIYFIE